MKFKVYDRIRVKSDSRGGTVTGVHYNSVYGRTEYLVQWDHTVGIRWYDEDDSLNWETESPAVRGGGIDFIPITLTIDDIKASSCDHKWTLYHGLSETFEYCVTCDEKKK